MSVTVPCLTGAGASLALLTVAQTCFHLHVGLVQGCPLSPVLLFIWIEPSVRPGSGVCLDWEPL